MSDEAISKAPAEFDDVMVTSIEAGAFGSFTGGVALTFATRLLMLVGVIGSSVVVARWLGPQGFGALAVLNATIALTVQLGSAGLPSANTYFVARDRSRLGSVWANSVVFAFVGGTLFALFVVALAKAGTTLIGDVSPNLLVIAALSIPFQLLTLLGLNVLLATDRIGQMNLLDSMSPLFVLFNAIIVLVFLRSNLTMLVSFNTGAAIVLGLWMTAAIVRLANRQSDTHGFRPDAALFKSAMKYGLKFSVAIWAAILIYRVDLLIVSHFRGLEEAGVYAVASQVAALLVLLPGVIGTLLFPRITNQSDPAGTITMRATRHTTFIMLVICLLAAPASFLLPVLYGASFAPAPIQLLILLPGVYLLGIEAVLVQHFNSIGIPIALPLFWVLTLAVNVSLNLIFVPEFGARAAAVSSTIAYSLIFLLVTWYFLRHTGARLSQIFVLRGHELLRLFKMNRRDAESRHGI
jgi:O-antigen/teichoic acid export membrane protein